MFVNKLYRHFQYYDTMPVILFKIPANEGNVFSCVCLSVNRNGQHMTITHDALAQPAVQHPGSGPFVRDLGPTL